MIEELKALFKRHGYSLSRNAYRQLPDKPVATSTIEKNFGSWSNMKDQLNCRQENLAPRILLLDIETSPMEVLVWGLFKQRIPPDNVLKEWSILSWSAKWLFEPDVMSAVVKPEEAVNRTEGSILKGIWNLIDEADAIVAYNGDRFDLRKLNAKFFLYDYPPPMPYQSIDTYKISKRNFAFPSYKLNYLLDLIDNLRKKIETNYELWKRCVRGEEKALKEMRAYNEQDVFILEDLYVKLRPWIRSHPNFATYVECDGPVCPTCGSEDLDWRGAYNTPSGRYEAFRCLECGAIGRSRFTSIDKRRRKEIVVSTAR